MDNLTEAAGYAALAAFAYFIWPPAALLVVGLTLVLFANVRSARRTARRQATAAAGGTAPAGPSWVERLARAAAAYRSPRP